MCIRDRPAAPLRGSPGGEAGVPRPGERPVLLLLLLVAALQVFSWTGVHGYLVADEVEFLDRAQFVYQGGRHHSGEILDPGTLRSFAFSGLLMGLFPVYEWLHLEDERVLVFLARLLQMALGLLVVLTVVRAGSRYAGRSAGLAAGLIAATNPVFLQYSVSPLSATAATLCVALGLSALLREGGMRRGLVAGSWFGLGLMLAFQTLALVAVVLIVVLVRDRLRRGTPSRGLLLALVLFVLAQCLLDLLLYGSFGSSLRVYVVANFVGVLTTVIYEAGFQRLGMWLYDHLGVAESVDQESRAVRGAVLSKLQAREWYLLEIPRQLLVWPVLACLALGIARGFRGIRWSFVLLLAVPLINAVALSTKGSKSFRLWMPLLPMLAILAGSGWALLRGRAPGLPRRILAGAVLLAGVVLGVQGLLELNRAKHGGYWEAMEIVNRDAAERLGPGPDHLVAASAYHWAVQFRASPQVRLVKFAHHLDEWPALDEAQRAEVLAQVSTLDWFLAHLQVLSQNPDFLRAVNPLFEVERVIYHPESFEILDPLFLLRRRTGDPGARTLFEVYEGVDPAEYAARIQFPAPIDFRRRLADGSEHRLVFLGFDAETGLAGGTQTWLTYHWLGGGMGGRSYMVVDRVTDPWDEVLQNNHFPAWEAYPTSVWEPGWIVRESFLLPWASPKLELQFGRGAGPSERGESIPARLWLDVVELSPARDAVVGHMRPYAPGEAGADPETGLLEPPGPRWSGDGLFLAGEFPMAVPAGAAPAAGGEDTAAAPD